MRKGIVTKRFSSAAARGLYAGLVFFCAITVSAQNVKNTDYKADQSLKSNARVNPSTLAMELSVPIGGYQGRAGNGLPVAFDYSSKVWQVYAAPASSFETSYGIVTDTRPQYAKRTAAGWTSTLGSPRIDYETNTYNGELENGGIYTDYTCITPCSPPPAQLYSVKRLHVVMPDGASHEVRQNDTVNNCGSPQTGCVTDLTGTYLSVDGSKLRLEYTAASSTLYLPDGSRYLFGSSGAAGPSGHLATTFVDRNGNRMDYDSAYRRWTDTVARIVNDPLPLNWDAVSNQTVGDQAAGFPGLNNGTMNVSFSWRYLKDPNGGESGLDDPAQNLSYGGDRICQGNSFTLVSPHLFITTDAGTRVCALNATFNPVVLTKITLANGQSYQFKYNTYGEIIRIIYPTGAYEKFRYDQIPPVQISDATYDQANRGVVERWVSPKGDGTDEMHWTYLATWQYQQPYKVTTTAPDNTQTEQYLLPDSLGGSSPYGFGDAKTGRSYEDRVLSSASPRQLLRRHLTGYEWTGTQAGGYSGATRDVRPNKEISIIFEPGSGSALAQMSETVYDTAGSADPQYFSALNPKLTKTYNYIALDLNTAQNSTIDQIYALFSSSNLANISETDYLYDANYKARNLVSLPIAGRLKDAAGNIKAQSAISYDEIGGYPIISVGTDAHWQDPATNYRGNVTTTKSWSDVANNQFIQTHAQYDNFGNLRNSWDAKEKVSTIDFSSAYAFAYPTTITSPIPDTSGANGSTQAFTTTSVYDFTTGLPTSVTDANNQTTQIQYNDPLLRPTKTIAPNGQQTITEYGAGTSAATSYVKVRTQIDDVNWKEGYSWYDGLGRAIKSQSKDTNGDVYVETLYDSVGRAWRTSNPYRANETKLWTETAFDTAGRAWKITTPDGAHVDTAYSLSTTTGSQIGTVVTVTDQASKQRRSVTNALGQLTRVDEPDINNNNQLGTIDSPYQATYYTYDTLNNLVTVNQGSQTRTFGYDSLSRLKQATNPESGLIQYSYDNNGNLLTKTDARPVTTSYGYDNLNRVKSRSYSDGVTPAVSYTYDNLPYAKGKLIKLSSSVSTTEYTQFDNLGRVLAHKQTTDGQFYNTSYTYNLSGALTDETYPSGRAIKNVLDANGDLSQVKSKKNGNSGFYNYAKSFAYTSAGAVSSMQLGNGKWESTQFNSRLQPTQIALGTVRNGTDKLKLNYDYGSTNNNGNVLSQQITVPTTGTTQGFTATQNYTYDSLNRLKQAVETIPTLTGWQQTFTYDRYGNRNFDVANTTTLGGCPVNVCNPTVNTANNRLNGYSYDNAGNTTNDGNGKTFTYDAENKQTQVVSGGQTVGQYFYDGDGKRVKKVNPQTGETTIFVYDAGGKMVAEYSTIAPSTAKVSYLTSDALGTPRINTNEKGEVFARHDFLPFGEEINSSITPARNINLQYGDDGIKKKFTSYERDTETELDFAQARMYANKLGRFTSPDNFINDTEIPDPMSWNLYAYVRNNPLRYIDPTGERILIEFEDENGNKQTAQYLKGKLYTGTFNKKGQFVRGDVYTGNNSYATKVQGYLNTLKGDNELASRLGTLERSSRNHTIMNTDNLNNTGSEPLSESNADKNIPTGSTISFNADKPLERPISGEKSESTSPIIVLAHELLGHSWDFDQGRGHPIDKNGNDDIAVPVPGDKNGGRAFIKYYEIAAVAVENRARALVGEPNRTFYMGLPIPNKLPSTKPPIFIRSKP